jgi:hypothetical protein
MSTYEENIMHYDDEIQPVSIRDELQNAVLDMRFDFNEYIYRECIPLLEMFSHDIWETELNDRL